MASSSSKDFSVVAPRGSVSGSSIAKIAIDGNTRDYAVFPNAYGRQPTFDPNETRIIGRAIASMHEAMRQISSEQLPSLRTDVLIQDSLHTILKVDSLTHDFKSSILECATSISEYLRTSKQPEYLVIHGDLCDLNCRIQEELVTFFDFDDSCRGSQLYDLSGWVFSAAASIDDIATLHRSVKSYIRGYRDRQPIRWDLPTGIPHLALAHLIRSLAFLANNNLIPIHYWPAVEEKSLARITKIKSLTDMAFE